MAASHIFISYSRLDLRFARELHTKLLNAGLPPWQDINEVDPGVRWADYTRAMLNKADHIILLLSHQSIHGIGFVREEFRWALERAAKFPKDVSFLIPLILDDCPIPPDIAQYNAIPFGRGGVDKVIQWIQQKKEEDR
jgi:hypothetical protein